ncbi:MAG: SusD/RagB family nutrient-binding outer membrane lipoprotein, partial [Bacteroidales bacterium]|nr:SusD/RagB family nutrient-binding outer membrane lipoprotein [Bacteroidales bacterium]
FAFFEEEAVEAYSDYRRLVAMGNNVIQLDNPKNDANQFPQRFTYGSSDVTTNVNVRNAYGDGNYVYTEKVWWAGGTR